MKIFCGNLSWELTDEELRAAFEQHGTVENARVIRNYETGQPKGFGFVSMRNTEEAIRAATALDGTELRGRLMRCRQAVDRPMRTTETLHKEHETS